MRCLATAILIGSTISISTLTAAAQSGQPAVDTAGTASASSPEQDKLRLLSAKRYPGQIYVLPATIETTQWGWFNNAQPPVLHVRSGDTIIFETMMHSHNQVVPGTSIETIKKLRTDFPGRGPHTLTGPVFIEGAEPGDVLKVHINKIVPRAYGVNFNVPGMFGEFPSKFPDGQVKYFYLDLDRKVAEFAPGIEIPLAPFPGTLGVAREEPGQYSSVPPGRYAGNLDVRELKEGASLYVPVFVKGALLWTGDSHAAQGNGEINLTALETAYKGMSVTVEVVKTMKLDWPRIETEDAWITLGIDKDLNKALDLLKAQTIKFLAERDGDGEAQAMKMMMANWDCRVAQVVNINKGLYCYNLKSVHRRRSITPAPLPEAETGAYLVTTGAGTDLNAAMDQASWAMIDLLEKQKKLARLDAYGLASMVMDCRVAPPAEEQKKVHCLVPKSVWVASR
jgi:acetamidase/formamidase